MQSGRQLPLQKANSDGGSERLRRTPRRSSTGKSTPSRCYHIEVTKLEANRYLDKDTFVNAIAPKGDLDKIDRAQYAILFRVADSSRRDLVSWDDFCVFQTMLKRPDADYWMAFQYFDMWV